MSLNDLNERWPSKENFVKSTGNGHEVDRKRFESRRNHVKLFVAINRRLAGFKASIKRPILAPGAFFDLDI
jgi:hypothetical protein